MLSSLLLARTEDEVNQAVRKFMAEIKKAFRNKQTQAPREAALLRLVVDSLFEIDILYHNDISVEGYDYKKYLFISQKKEVAVGTSDANDQLLGNYIFLISDEDAKKLSDCCCIF
jgi:hypothetical protein